MSEFSVQAAREMTDACKRILRKIEDAGSIQIKLTKDVSGQLGRNSGEGVFVRLADLWISEGTLPPGREYNDLRVLLTAVYKYLLMKGTETELQAILSRTNDIRWMSQSISPRTNPLIWFVTPRKKKLAAEEAFAKLEALMTPAYITSVSQTCDQLYSIATTSRDTVEQHYGENRGLYSGAIAEVMPEITSRRDSLPSIQPLLTFATELYDMVAALDENCNARKEQIRKAALKAAAEGAIEFLRTIPIEEINRDKRGIRVKTLRDNGIVTVADAFLATQGYLAGLNGIGWNQAYDIKSIAKRFAEEASQGAKLRLSADNRTDEATALVQELCAYIRTLEARKDIDAYLKEHGQAIKRYQRILQSVSNAFQWIYSEADEKQETIEAYRKLREIRDGRTPIREAHEKLEQINSGIEESVAWYDFSGNPIPYFKLLEEIVPELMGNDDARYGLPEELAREIQEQCFFPDGLLCTLRRYQEWGVKYILHQERVLLGDEMGLGKTIQAIAAMVSLKNTGATHFMVICPASVIENWFREVRKHSRLQVTKIHGQNRMEELASWINTGGVAITTYETTAYISLEPEFKFSMLVVDEAHYIKNSSANRSRNAKRIGEHAERLLFMTGTALENRVDEMIALIRLLQPKVAAVAEGMKFMAAAPQFRYAVAPVYYRRKREDVLTELPELIENAEWCVMTPQEETAYEEAVLAKKYAESRRVSWTAPDLAYSSKAKRMKQLLEEAKAEGRKVLVFSFFLDTVSKAMRIAGEAGFGPITGSVSPQRRQEIIDRFDKAESGAVLVCQIQAGGTGLNIQSASMVIICEPQLKPSIENQAISRAYRMGQSRNVLVHRLLCEESIDERVTNLLEEKQAIFDAFADKSVAAQESFELDEHTFGDLINEEIERIKEKRRVA